MSESDMRGKVVKALKGLDAFSVENPCLPGTPDVNYIEGWLELKWLRNWPDREETIVKIEHYTPQQRLFHRRRWRKEGNMYVILQCKREWLIFDGDTSSEYLGKVNKKSLYELAALIMENGFKKEVLLDFLREGTWKLE